MNIDLSSFDSWSDEVKIAYFKAEARKAEARIEEARIEVVRAEARNAEALERMQARTKQVENTRQNRSLGYRKSFPDRVSDFTSRLTLTQFSPVSPSSFSSLAPLFSLFCTILGLKSTSSPRSAKISLISLGPSRAMPWIGDTNFSAPETPASRPKTE